MITQKRLLRIQVQRAQQLASVKRTVMEEFAQEVADLTPLGVEAKLRAKLDNLQHKNDILNEESSSTASSLQEVTFDGAELKTTHWKPLSTCR